MAQYIHEIGNTPALPNGAAETAPLLSPVEVSFLTE